MLIQSGADGVVRCLEIVFQALDAGFHRVGEVTGTGFDCGFDARRCGSNRLLDQLAVALDGPADGVGLRAKHRVETQMSDR